MSLSKNGINGGFELRQLKAFVTVADKMNFTKAAELLFITQPGLTKVIKDLEDSLAMPLFFRTTRTVKLTGDGLHFLPIARRLINDIDSAVLDLRERSSGTRGSVHIAVGTAFASTVLVQAVARFRQERPHAFIHIRDDNSEGIIRRVINAEVDFAFGTFVAEPAMLESVPLLDAPLGILMPEKSSYAKGGMDLQKLAELPILRNSSDTSIASIITREGFDIFSRNERCIEASQLTMMLDLVHAGMGVAVVSALGASHPRAKGLRFMRVKGLDIKRRMHFVRRIDRPMSIFASNFLKTCLDALLAASLHPDVKIVLPRDFNPVDF